MFSSPALIDQAQLTNNCNELKDMFCKCFVAGHRDLGASRLSVYALGKETPGYGLHPVKPSSWQYFSLLPSLRRSSRLSCLPNTPAPCAFRSKKMEPTSKPSAPDPRVDYDPFWVQTQFEKIQSKLVLYQVISNLHLTQRWGEKYKEGDLPVPLAYNLLKRGPHCRPTAQYQPY